MNTMNIDINALAQNSIAQNETYPQEPGDNRFFTATEISGILDPAKETIEESLNTISDNTNELNVLGSQSELLKTELDNDIESHKTAAAGFDTKIGELDTKILRVRKKIEVLKSTPNTATLPTTKKEGNNLGLWLILAGLAIDLITIMATWSTQREAFGIDAITERVKFVMGIFFMSIILHFAHKKFPNKATMAAICVGLVMSFAVAVHVVWATATAAPVATTSELSLDLAESTAETVTAQSVSSGGLLTMFKEKPGIAEFFFMFLCFVYALVSTFVIDRANKPRTSQQFQQPRSPKDYVIPLLESQLIDYEAEKGVITHQKEQEEAEFAERISGYKERLGQIVRDVKDRNDSIADAKKKIQNEVRATLQNLNALCLTVKTMKSMLEGTLESTIQYALASEKNVKAYFGINW